MTRPFRALAALVFCAACGDADAQDPVVMPSPCATLETDVFWESSTWPPDESCPWLELPNGTTIAVPHDLGRTPRDVAIYLSFDPNGRLSAPSAGDMSRIVSVTAAEVQIQNRTDETFFLKLVLH